MRPASRPAAERLAAAAAGVLAGAVVLMVIAWTLGLSRELGWVIYREQFLAAVLTATLPAVFLARRVGAGPWALAADVVLAAVALGAGVRLTVGYPTLVEEAAYDPGYALPVAVALLVLVLEALRRSAGLGITAVVLGFLAYGFFGSAVPGPLAARSITAERLATQLALDTNALMGTPLLVAATVVVVFVLFGQLLNRCGGGNFFTDLALAAMGRSRGGSAKISVIASALFGSISGSAVSNVATTGVITIPLMRRSGFALPTAAAIEAVASTGGQLMPPIMGAAAFLMAEFLQISYAQVVLAAVVPALLYYAAVFIQADLRAAQSGISRIPASQIPPLGRTLRAGWSFLIPFAVLLTALFGWNLEAERAALYAAAAMALLGFAPNRASRLRLRDVPGLLRDTGFAVLDIVVITAAAGLIIGVLNFTGLSFGLTLLLVEIGSANILLLLLIAAAASVVLGMGMPTVGVYVLLAALVAPALVELGVEPIAAHLFVLYFGIMSMITPPVAVASFAAASLSGAAPMRTSLEAMRFGWTAYIIPFLFVGSPSLLLMGTPLQLALAVPTALGGVWLVSVGAVGHLVAALGPARRAAFVLAGLALMVPAGAFPGALWTDIGGAVLGGVLVAAEAVRMRRLARTAGRGGGRAVAG